MQFQELKTSILARPDKSKKGSWDKPIIPLCNAINQLEHYYTSSSCSGRIALFVHKSRKKNDTEWLFVTHDIANPDDIIAKIKNYADKYPVYFVQQASILHLGCDTIERAQALVEIATRSGFKRSGIIATKKKIIVELLCTEHLYCPIYDNKLLVDEQYIRYLVQEANKKLQISWDAIERLHKNTEKFP